MEDPKPGTYGAIVRSTTPLPWRRWHQMLCFTSEEFAREGPGVIMKKSDAVMQELKDHR